MSRKTYQEIDAVLMSLSLDSSRFPGMTYEEGIEAALTWATGERDEEPYPKQ